VAMMKIVLIVWLLLDRKQSFGNGGQILKTR
jgi:hypothetical protein